MNAARSLTLITIDCFRADHAGFLGYSRTTTPFLDSLAKVSTIFTNAVVAGAPTYYSFPGIMASRHPLDLGRDVIGIASGEPTIALELRRRGFATGAFLAGNPYLSRRFGYDSGFDKFHDFLGDGGKEGEFPPSQSESKNRFNAQLERICHSVAPLGTVYDELYFRYCQAVAKRTPASMERLRCFPSADIIVDEALAWLDTLHGAPFFLWLHLMDPHSPYYPKEEALRTVASTTDSGGARLANSYWNRGDIGAKRLLRGRQDVMDLYDGGIRWADGQVGRFVDHLQRRELWNDSVLAVTADHGEEFLEHGGRYHSPAKLMEELIHVPLLLHGPGGRPDIHREPFSLIHLAPTLLDFLGVESPEAFCGISARRQTDADRARPAIAESVACCKNPFERSQRMGPRVLAVRESKYKLVVDFGSSQSVLFDLEHDPGELNPLAEEPGKPVRRRLLESARAHIARSSESRNPGQRLDAIIQSIRLSADSVSNVPA